MKERRDTWQRYLEIWDGTRDLEELDDLVTASFAGHIGSRDRGIAELKNDIRAYHDGIEGVHFEVMHQFAEGDHVSTRLLAHVTDRATGVEFTLAGLNVSRWEAGLLAEEWAVWEPLPANS